MLAPAVVPGIGGDEDDGHVSPELASPSSWDEDDRPHKRSRNERSPTSGIVIRNAVDMLGDDEALALAMLRMRTRR